VDKMRAQFLPWPLARAIHSHSAGSTKLTAMTTVMMSGRQWLTWAAVRLRPAHCRW